MIAVAACDVNEVSAAILRAPASIGQSKLVTIDGHAGAGKTTLASALQISLAGKLSCAIIHLDDLYEGWNDPLGDHLTQTFRDQVLPGIATGGSYFLPRYDWVADAPGAPTEYEFSEVVIIEGVGAGQRINRPWTAISVWLAIAPQIGLERVLARDGSALEPAMERFFYHQQAHFLKEGSEVVADYRISGAP